MYLQLCILYVAGRFVILIARCKILIIFAYTKNVNFEDNLFKLIASKKMTGRVSVLHKKVQN